MSSCHNDIHDLQTTRRGAVAGARVRLVRVGDQIGSIAAWRPVEQPRVVACRYAGC